MHISNFEHACSSEILIMAIKAREAAAKEGADGATGDIALHMPAAAA